METLKEFRPENPNVVNPTTKARNAKGRGKKKRKVNSKQSLFNTTNIALALCAVMLGYGQFKKSAQVDALTKRTSQLSKELDELKMEKMKYMADKKIQEVAKETMNHKVAHITSLEAVIEKSKSDLARVTGELTQLKKVKMTALEYKAKVAALEKAYQQRLDAHNRESTDTIARMGRKMMAEVDKGNATQNQAPSHTVRFNNSSSSQATDKSSDSDKWSANNMEF